MKNIQTYKKKQGQSVIAIQLDFDTDGFSYNKWGGEQRCKQGDWIVNNNSEVYTIDKKVFEQTYREVGTGIFEKSSVVWAEVAQEDGAVTTKEGNSAYKVGDYIVSNNKEGTDKYCIRKEKFEEMYEPS